MSKKHASSTSKRQTSKNKAKVVRKRRENKRDLKKAAKAMRSSGLRIRPKRQREKAKLALKLSSKDPNKERVLNALLLSRERVKVTKQERRQAYKESLKKQKAAMENGDSDNEQGEGGLDVEEEEEDGRKDAAWMHPISARQLEQQERAERRVEHVQREEQERQRGVRRFLAFPPGQQGSGDPAVQLRKIISVMRLEVPVFLFTLDARCALESVPWAVLDDVIATAVAFDAEEEKKAGAVEGKARHIFFVFTRADLVSAEGLVRGAVSVANAVKERYLDTEPAVERLITFSCAAASPHASSQSIMFLIKSLNQKIAEIVAYRKQLNVAAAAADGNNADPPFSKKDINKVVFCVFGYPNTGRTSLCAALAKRASESVCRVIFPGNISEIVQTQPRRNASGSAAAAAAVAASSEQPRRRFRFDEAKPITLLNVSDSSALQSAPIAAGDIVFHRHATPDRMNEPEQPAMRFLDALPRQPDFEAMCRAFGQPGCTNGRHLLTCIGRTVKREHGFYTPHTDEAIVSTSIGQGLFASHIEGINQPSLRVFHQTSAQKRDASNATRIGARVFLHELCRGEWGLRWSTNKMPASARNSAQDIAACLGAVFEAPPAPLRRGRGGDDDEEDETAQAAKKSESTAQKRSRNFVERGIANVIALQAIAQTMPLANALTASNGLSLPAELFQPQVDMNLADVEQQFQHSDDEDEEDDDGGSMMDEGCGDEDFDDEEFSDDEEGESDDDASYEGPLSDGSSDGTFSNHKEANKVWAETKKAQIAADAAAATSKKSTTKTSAAAAATTTTKKQQVPEMKWEDLPLGDFEDEEEEEETDFGFVTGAGNFFEKKSDADDLFDSAEDEEESD